METSASRRDLDFPIGVFVGVALIVGSAAYLGETAILMTLLTFTGGFGTVFGFALLNRWLDARGITGYARLGTNVVAVVVVLAGLMVTDLFFAVAGNIVGAVACLAAAVSDS